MGVTRMGVMREPDSRTLPILVGSAQEPGSRITLPTPFSCQGNKHEYRVVVQNPSFRTTTREQ